MSKLFEENRAPEFKAGNSLSKDWWSSLTPEQKEEHKQKSIKGAQKAKLEARLRDAIEDRAEEIVGHMSRHIMNLLESDSLDHKELKLLLDRFMGTPKQSVDVTSNGEQLPAIEFNFAAGPKDVVSNQ